MTSCPEGWFVLVPPEASRTNHPPMRASLAWPPSATACCRSRSCERCGSTTMRSPARARGTSAPAAPRRLRGRPRRPDAARALQSRGSGVPRGRRAQPFRRGRLLGVPGVGGAPDRRDDHRRRQARHRRRPSAPLALAGRNATSLRARRPACDHARAHAARPRRGPAREGAAAGGPARTGPAASCRSARSSSCSSGPTGIAAPPSCAPSSLTDPAPTRSDLEDACSTSSTTAGIARPRDQRAAALRRRDDRPRLPLARPAAGDRGRQRHLARAQARARERRRQAGEARSRRPARAAHHLGSDQSATRSRRSRASAPRCGYLARTASSASALRMIALPFCVQVVSTIATPVLDRLAPCR